MTTQQLDDTLPVEEEVSAATADAIEASVAAVETAPAVTPGAEAPAASPPFEAAPEEGAAFELPAELVGSAPATDTGTLADIERQELVRLRQGQAEINQFRQEQQESVDIQQRTRDYEARNIDPDTAKYIAEEVRTEYLRGKARLDQQIMYGQIEQGRRNAAIYYGKEYGVSPAALTGFGNPQDMERYAQLLSYTGKIDKRVAKVEQSQVPEQHFDGGQAATGGPRTPLELLAWLGNNPDAEITTEQNKMLTDAGFGNVT